MCKERALSLATACKGRVESIMVVGCCCVTATIELKILRIATTLDLFCERKDPALSSGDLLVRPAVTQPWYWPALSLSLDGARVSASKFLSS